MRKERFRAIGVSNLSVAQMETFRRIAPLHVAATASVSSISRCAGCWDQGVSVALWGARHPEQLAPAAEVGGWSLEPAVKAEIDRVLRERITDPVGSEFMAPPSRPQ